MIAPRCFLSWRGVCSPCGMGKTGVHAIVRAIVKAKMSSARRLALTFPSAWALLIAVTFSTGCRRQLRWAGMVPGAFQAVPGSQADLVRVVEQVVEQPARVTGQVVGRKVHFVEHAGDVHLEHEIKELVLVAEVAVDLGLVHPRRRPDPIDACAGNPIVRELLRCRRQEPSSRAAGSRRAWSTRPPRTRHEQSYLQISN